jgi:cytochrome c-type biogenesis protein CcmH/NrfG
LSKLGNRAAAILEFRTTLRLDPKYPNAKFELAMAYADSQNTAAAAGLLKEVAAAEPENGNVRFQLGSALARQGDCASAVPLLEAAPEAAETYYILGGCLKKLNRPSEAEGAMAKVKQLREDSAARTRATFLAATAHKKAEAGDLEGAIADYRASLEKRNDPAVAIDLAVALLKKREAEEVIRLLQRDASPLARYQIALAYTQAGQPDAAKGALEAALAAKPDFAEAWYQLGVILLPGDNAGAERALASAVRLRPDEAPMRLAWAEALEKCGQPAEAKRQRDLAARLRMLN